MLAKIANAQLELLQGDIVKQDVDAIVNAANTSLLGGGGVDGAIHRAAGIGLLNETRKLGGCDTGDAKISGGYNLPAKHVIHAVGPVYRRDDPESPRLLASAYRRSLEVAIEHQLTSVAFPAISTGIYRYPLDAAARISLQTVLEVLMDTDKRGTLTLVRFVLFNASSLDAYASALQRLARTRPEVNLAP
jgi:O-acetyl-ADP-ribose deacetylase (regulator of RNase III)